MYVRHLVRPLIVPDSLLGWVLTMPSATTAAVAGQANVSDLRTVDPHISLKIVPDQLCMINASWYVTSSRASSLAQAWEGHQELEGSQPREVSFPGKPA